MATTYPDLDTVPWYATRNFKIFYITAAVFVAAFLPMFCFIAIPAIATAAFLAITLYLSLVATLPTSFAFGLSLIWLPSDAEWLERKREANRQQEEELPTPPGSLSRLSKIQEVAAPSESVESAPLDKPTHCSWTKVVSNFVAKSLFGSNRSPAVELAVLPNTSNQVVPR